MPARRPIDDLMFPRARDPFARELLGTWREQSKVCEVHRCHWYGAEHCPQCVQSAHKLLEETHPVLTNALSRKTRGTHVRSEGYSAIAMLQHNGMREAAEILREVYTREPVWERPEQVELAAQMEEQARPKPVSRFSLIG